MKKSEKLLKRRLRKQELAEKSNKLNLSPEALELTKSLQKKQKKVAVAS